MPSSPTYPRIECSIDGCRRGISTLPRAVEWICPVHWRQVPATMRRRQSLFSRRYRAALRKGDTAMADRCGMLSHRNWQRILALFELDPAGSELPVPIAEDLRRVGLL